jgi:hypothetical protein
LGKKCAALKVEVELVGEFDFNVVQDVFFKSLSMVSFYLWRGGYG